MDNNLVYASNDTDHVFHMLQPEVDKNWLDDQAAVAAVCLQMYHILTHASSYGGLLVPSRATRCVHMMLSSLKNTAYRNPGMAPAPL